MAERPDDRLSGRAAIRLGTTLAWRMAAFAAAVLWPAGTWRWWQGWVLIGLWLGFALAVAVQLARHDPALLAERMRASPLQRDQEGWDKLLMGLLLVPGLALYIVPGLDVLRYGWSEPLPLAIQVTAMLVHLPCLVVIAWVMRENTFLSRVVKLDRSRGQHVITTGPYAWVRHPMYTMVIVLTLAMPTALGSRYALVPAVLVVVLVVIRTALEDRLLHARLAGYADYARVTRYRLLPGVW